MISRSHGHRHTDLHCTSVDLYPSPLVYVDTGSTIDDPRCDEVGVWAHSWIEKAREYFPFCRFDHFPGIHDDCRVYVTVTIWSNDGSHAEAAEWLREHTEE